jgi:hypothetical protein
MISGERTAFGKYNVLARLGRGGMGDVYLAVHLGPADVSKLIVVKQLRGDLASVPEARSMFLDEARISTRLNHPNVVQTYEAIEEGDSLYLTMEFLQAFLNQGGAQIPPERRASVEADVRELANRVGAIEVRSNVDGAQILIDDEVEGTTPLAQPLLVSLGRRKVSATKDGLPTQQRFLDVAAGDHPVVVLDFPTAAPTVAAAPAPVASGPPAAPPPSAPRTGTWIAWGVTGALGAATVITYGPGGSPS